MNFQETVYVFSVAIGTFLGGQAVLRSADCNGNGLDDSMDLRPQPGFLAEPSYAVKGYPRSMITEDFNGDGKPDLITTGGSALLGRK